MESIGSILVALNRDERAPHTLAKAIRIARAFGARLDLFLCDAERAFFLQHDYDTRATVPARQASVAEALRYLDDLWHSHGVTDVAVTLAAACESPLYQGIVHRVRSTRPDLVVRSLGRAGSSAPAPTSAAGRSIGGYPLDPTDWELVRTCPAPLLLTRTRAWKSEPSLAAAVDLGGEEATDLTEEVLHSAHLLASSLHGTLEVIYGGRLDAPAPQSESWGEILSRRVSAAKVKAHRMHVVLGEPAMVVPQFAAEQAYDLVVLGALTHRQALTALVGTLTGRLLERVDSDFLLVKPLAYRSPVI